MLDAKQPCRNDMRIASTREASRPALLIACSSPAKGRRCPGFPLQPDGSPRFHPVGWARESTDVTDFVIEATLPHAIDHTSASGSFVRFRPSKTGAIRSRQDLPTRAS